MGFFGKVFGKGGNEHGESLSMPWDQRPSIYEHIRSHVPADGPGLTEGGETLPDEQRINEGNWIRRVCDAVADEELQKSCPIL